MPRGTNRHNRMAQKRNGADSGVRSTSGALSPRNIPGFLIQPYSVTGSRCLRAGFILGKRGAGIIMKISLRRNWGLRSSQVMLILFQMFILIPACGTIESVEFQPVATKDDMVLDGRGILVERALDAFLTPSAESQSTLKKRAQDIETWLLRSPLFEDFRDSVQTTRLRVLHFAAEYPDNAPENAERVRTAVEQLREELRAHGRGESR